MSLHLIWHIQVIWSQPAPYDMATSTIKSQCGLTDISDQCTYNLPDGIFYIRCLYDSATGRIDCTFSVNAATAFDPSAAIFTIPAAYGAGSTTVYFPAVGGASGLIAGRARINGNVVKQNISHSCTAVYGHLVYKMGGVILKRFIPCVLSERRCA